MATLTAVTAVGALVGSLAMAAVSSRAARPDRLMIVGIIAWHVTVLAFSQVHGLGLALLVLSLYGAAMSFSMVTMSTLLLETTEAEFRGRVMGVRMLAVYGLPMGLLLGGVLSDRYNVQTATLILGLIGIGMLVAALVAWPELWRKRPAR